MNPIITIKMTNGNEIKIELYPEFAPNTVNSMIDLILKEKLNHKRIMRIAHDFVLQFTYNGFDHDAECEYIIEGEFEENQHYNPISFDKWVVGMGGDGQSISSGCDFFIVIGKNCQEKLNKKFTAFGKVIAGFDEVERIIKVPTRKIVMPESPSVDINEPVVDEVVEKVTVEMFGYTYQKPNILRYGES